MTGAGPDLVTGVTGQDGALLAALLLGRGRRVVGTHRPGRPPDRWRLDGLGIGTHPALELRAFDPVDAVASASLIDACRPATVFHLAGESSVVAALADPARVFVANARSTINLLEAVRRHAPDARFVLAASAEMFAPDVTGPLDETAPFAPATPYGASKLAAHAAVSAWRASFGLHAASAILFHHESEWRGDAFVTRTITHAAARIATGRADVLDLGNLDAARDFAYAPDVVAAMAAMAARTLPSDYVLATGRATRVRDFATAAFAALGMPLVWSGTGAAEVARDPGGVVRVRVDPARFRPADAPVRVGNAARARLELGFAPTLDVAEIAARMAHADFARAQAGR